MEAARAHAGPERARVSGYQKRLVALLALATAFEGFDTALASVALPALGREFEADAAALGGALSFAGFGMLASFLVLRLADRIGRKPALLLALSGYAAFSLATARAASLDAFATLQLGARLFMVAQLSLAYVILSEEMPPALRGRANGLLGTFAGVGAALPPFLLAPLERAGFGWRGLFAAGSLPLLLVPLYAIALRETEAFSRTRRVARISARAELRAFAALFGRGVRARFLALTALWFTVSFWSGGVLAFFFLYVQSERGWSAADLQMLPWGSVPAGLIGYLLAGFAMDRLGRRATAMLYLALSALATIVSYQAARGALIAGAYFAVVGLGGLWTVANTITAEAFPTRLRATAVGVAGSLFGRLGFVVGPLVSGRLAASLGATGDAMALLALVNVACIALVWRFVPETRGAKLED